MRSASWVGIAACLAACAPPPAAPAPRDVRREAQASGTRALLIAVSAVSDRVAWASGTQGTWLRTEDGGTTWQGGRVPGADSLQFRDVHGVDARTAYLLSIGNGTQSRIYKTNDGGASWQLQFTNAEPDAFYDCMDFWSPTRGLVVGDAVGTEMRVLRTTDGGAHWDLVPPSELPPAPAGEGSYAASGTCLVTRPGGHAWIAAADSLRSRVVHTHDFGRTWASHDLPITSRAGSGAQSVAFHDARRGLALAGGTTARSGDANVAVTGDGGSRWEAAGVLPLASGAWGGVAIPGSTDGRRYVAVGPSGAAWSRDEGASWTVLDSTNYWGVGAASADAVWAVGARGAITRFSGF